MYILIEKDSSLFFEKIQSDTEYNTYVDMFYSTNCSVLKKYNYVILDKLPLYDLRHYGFKISYTEFANYEKIDEYFEHNKTYTIVHDICKEPRGNTLMMSSIELDNVDNNYVNSFIRKIIIDDFLEQH